MQIVRSLALAPVFVLSLTAAGLCQQPMPPSGSPRAYVSATGGAAFGGEMSPLFAVEYGERIHEDVQGYATFTYFDDLMRTATRDDLDAVGRALTGMTGTPWSFQGRDRGVAFMVGAKYLVSTASNFRPYVGGGAGALNLKRTIVEGTRGDITDAFARDVGLGDAAFSTSDASTTQPIVEAVAGLGIISGRTYVDVGYRFRSAFGLAERLGFSQVTMGVGVTF